MTDLAKPEQQLLDLLKQHDSLGNGRARELLGWDADTYEAVKKSLLAKDLIMQGRGRGGSIKRSLWGDEWRTPLPEDDDANQAIGSEAIKPNGQQASKPLSQQALSCPEIG